MKRYFIESEYALPAEEFTSPPEQPETLQDKRRYPGAPGTPPEPKAAVEDPVNPTISAATEEAADAAKASEAGQTAARQARKKRSLLLQIAAVASSVVLVSNSFGLDFLGLDGLFNDSVIIGQVEAETKPVTPSAYAMPGLPLGGDTEFPELTDTEPKLADYNGYPYDIWIAEGTFQQASDGGWETIIHRFPYLDERSGGELIGPMATFFDRDGSPLDLRGSDETIWYDPSSNTLTLHGYTGEFLQIHRMPEGFSIRLEGVSTLSQFLFADGCSLRLTGDGTLRVNPQGKYEYGVLIRAAYSDACLMIDREVNFSFEGSECAVRIEATSAQKAVWLKDPVGFTNVRQATFVREDSKERIDPDKDSDSLHYYTWTLINRTTGNPVHGLGRGPEAPEPPQTEPATQAPTGPVITPPEETPPAGTTPEETLPDETTEAVPTEPVLAGEAIGGDSAFPVLPDPLPSVYPADSSTRGGNFIFSDDTGYFTLDADRNVYPAGRSDILYDKATNTLILNNCTGKHLQIEQMGTGFRILLIGKNMLSGTIEVFGNGQEAVAVTLAGSGYLSLNASGEYDAGLCIWGFDKEACVMIEDGVTLDAAGRESAILVLDTTAAKAIYYTHPEPLAGVRQEVFSRSSYSSGDGFSYDWMTVSEEGMPLTSVHFGGEVPPDPELPGLPVGGDAEFPALPNLTPNTPVPGYGVLNEDYIQLFDRESDEMWEFLYLNPAWTNDRVSPAGISYDPETNTLTLNNYHGAGISANLLGNGFTVELIGENELTQDFMVWGFYTGGSITFTGTGSLIINSSFTQEVGLNVIGEYSESCVMIDSGVTLDIFGKTNAMQVLNTSAEKAVWYLSGKPLENVRQCIDAEGATNGVIYRHWILTGNTEGSDVTHLHIEGAAASP